jgi:outer membrane protein assembly factor BamB
VRIAILIWITLAAAAGSGAQSWERLGPEGGMVLSLGVDSAGTVYLGTSDGHVFASEDRGARWQLRSRAGTRTDAVSEGILAWQYPQPKAVIKP